MKQKIMLAVGHKAFEEALIKKLKDRYEFIGVAPYREAILPEALKARPNIVIIRENLPGLANMSEIIYSLREQIQDTRIVFMATDRQAGDEFLATLVSYGVYDLFVGANVKIDSIANLVEHPNSFGDISMYAVKVSVDEKDNTKKVFETKIIQAAAPLQPEQKPKIGIPAISSPKKKEASEPVIDEEISLDFIQGASSGGELQVPRPQHQPKDVRFDDSFYSPTDYLTKTSKPVKLEPEEVLAKPVAVVELLVENKKAAEMDFEIVDDKGHPATGIHTERVDVHEKRQELVPDTSSLVPNKTDQNNPQSEKESIKTTESATNPSSKPFVNPVVISEGVNSTVLLKGSKRNKLMYGHPVSDDVQVMLFIRTEEFSENHTALNVAVKLAKDDMKTLFIATSTLSCLTYFPSITQEKLTVKALGDDFNFVNMLSYIAEHKYDYVVIDAHVDEDLSLYFLLNGKRFILMKQNKPWIHHFMNYSSKIGLYAKFCAVVLEEYTEVGISAKTIMSEYHPFGVIRIKDKKETNFFAFNAKMPAMLAKKNYETIEAYKELFNYIYGREGEGNE